MGSILIVLGVLIAIGLWWLSRQGVMSKPWLEQGPTVAYAPLGGVDPAIARTGLRVFLAVVGSLFALFISAYAIRMQMPDWRDVPLPNVVWLNTIMLILSSIALHDAGKAAARGDGAALRLGLLAAGVTALAFLSGQLLAWHQLTTGGYLLASNSANAFFYVLTGVHGVHVIGGMVALSRAIAGAWRDAPPERLRLSVRLCATYWHFLLFVWLVLLSILTGWAGTAIDLCRQVLG